VERQYSRSGVKDAWKNELATKSPLSLAGHNRIRRLVFSAGDEVSETGQARFVRALRNGNHSSS
jgi:hypothetical protein